MSDDMYESYVKQIHQYALLTAEEEQELSKQVQQGSAAARQKLIQANLRLVVSVANKFRKVPASIMDLIQEGNMGLMAAAAKYNHSFNTRFSTYAYTWILQYMLRYLQSKSSLISIPHRKNETIRKVEDARIYLQQKNGCRPANSEIAAYLGMDENELEQSLSYEYHMASLDSPCGDDGKATLGELLPDTSYSPEAQLLRSERNASLYRLMDTLPPKEKTVLYHRYNFAADTESKTLREISQLLGVSSETVRQMEIRAIRRLKKTVESDGSCEAFMA